MKAFHEERDPLSSQRSGIVEERAEIYSWNVIVFVLQFGEHLLEVKGEAING